MMCKKKWHGELSQTGRKENKLSIDLTQVTDDVIIIQTESLHWVIKPSLF